MLIVGGGQSGLVIAAHLKREGLERIAILDAAKAGEEGPWRTYARMTELRTPKTTVGAELGLPNLSLRRWREAHYGAAAWESFERLPRMDWAEYLAWYAEAVGLDIESETLAIDIREAGDLLRVDTMRRGRARPRYARTVVVATDLEGSGAWRVPDFVS